MWFIFQEEVSSSPSSISSEFSSWSEVNDVGVIGVGVTEFGVIGVGVKEFGVIDWDSGR